VSKGYVYVLSNPSMPGAYKIGRSVNGGCLRAKALYLTGVPEPFTVEFDILVDDAMDFEKRIHEALEHHRINDDREFFRCDLHVLIRCVLEEYLSQHDLVIICSDQEDAVFAAEKFSCSQGVHPFIVGSAFRYLTDKAVKEAIEKQHEWRAGQNKKNINS